MGQRCTACANPVNAFVAKVDKQRPPNTPCVFDVLLCRQCGHLMHSNYTGSVVRNMTLAEKKVLPFHRCAKEIREAQERVVANMIG